MEKKRVAPYDVSMKLNERLSDISQRLTDIVMHSKEMTMKDVIPIANKLLYETAQQQNMNLWNLCMMVAPDFEYVTKLTTAKPIFGHISGKRNNTHWICFMKEE